MQVPEANNITARHRAGAKCSLEPCGYTEYETLDKADQNTEAR